MRPLAVATLALLAAAGATAADLSTFERYFEDATMRIDTYHTGNATEETISLDRVVRQPVWAGSRVHLEDAYATGGYAVVVYDAASGARIFSRGYDTYFGEYRTTGPAVKGVLRTYQESALIPFPRKPIRFVIEARARGGASHPIFTTEIDPQAYTVVRESPSPGVEVIPALTCGDPHRCVDIAVLAEGYTASEEPKFRTDLARAVATLTAAEPFASAKDRFNISGVYTPSAESGCDEPSRGVWRDTVLGAGFDALGSERYLLSEDNRAIRDLAAHVPYDAILIMVNSPRYGGGGIYNLYCTFTSDNQWTPYVLVHEFGHAFAGLADEYYTSSV
ncbi:MAG: M64 family metallopeptidase, partial [Acidobacteriota bacterium]